MSTENVASTGGRRSKLAAVIAAVVAAVGAATTQGALAGSERPPGPTVVIVGDSLVHQSADELALLLQDDFSYSVDGKNSSTMCERIPDIERVARRDLDAMVIALGTNDVAQGWGTDDIVCLRRILDVTVDVPTMWIVPSYGAAQIDGALTDFAAGRANVIRADWNSADRVDDWHADDGIHHNADGQQGYAEFINHALRSMTSGAAS